MKGKSHFISIFSMQFFFSCWVYARIQKKLIRMSNICRSTLHFSKWWPCNYLNWSSQAPSKGGMVASQEPEETADQASKTSQSQGKTFDTQFSDTQPFFLLSQTCCCRFQTVKWIVRVGIKLVFMFYKVMLEPKMNKDLDSRHGIFKQWKNIWDT